jgi:hypothetical protein
MFAVLLKLTPAFLLDPDDKHVDAGKPSNWLYVPTITNRSGLFGWGDSSRHAMHVFDDQGRASPAFKSSMVIRDGLTFTELRLPEDYSAAIVRRN